MEWAVLVVALVLLLGLALARATAGRSNRARRARRQRGQPQLDPGDEAELARGFASADQDGAHTLETLLERRLQIVQSRRIPLRGIRAAPGPHTGRLIFADGTVLLGRARRPGELYKLALNIPGHAMCLDTWTHEADGTVLHFHWPGGGSAELVAIGLDQAD